MKTFVQLLSVVLLSTIAARADLHASSGHSGGGHGGSSGGHGGHVSSGHVFLGPHHHGSGVFFYGGFYDPWWYYDYYPGYYSYYPYRPAYSDPNTGQAYSPSGPSYKDLGEFWGTNLKKGSRTPDDLIAFVQSDLAHASETGKALFRGGFLKTYREGAPIVDRALHDAGVNAPETAGRS